jgi:hypothetical protein
MSQKKLIKKNNEYYFNNDMTPEMTIFVDNNIESDDLFNKFKDKFELNDIEAIKLLNNYIGENYESSGLTVSSNKETVFLNCNENLNKNKSNEKLNKSGIHNMKDIKKEDGLGGSVQGGGSMSNLGTLPTAKNPNTEKPNTEKPKAKKIIDALDEIIKKEVFLDNLELSFNKINQKIEMIETDKMNRTDFVYNLIVIKKFIETNYNYTVPFTYYTVKELENSDSMLYNFISNLLNAISLFNVVIPNREIENIKKQYLQYRDNKYFYFEQ